MENQRHAGPTIGLIISDTRLPWQRRQWLGVVDAANAHGVNLICFPGGELAAPYENRALANVLYDLVGPDNVDGLLVWRGGWESHVTQEALTALLSRYKDALPLISVEGAPLLEIPTLDLDDYASMQMGVDHLIEVHGYRHIAFVEGPLGHIGHTERQRAYTETLAAHGIEPDPRLVVPRDHAFEADTWLLDQHKLRPRIDLEAVVASQDGPVLTLLERLQRRGLRVPEDVALLGFDDYERSRTVTPPITSVRPPFYAMGHRAVEMLLSLMAGETVPNELALTGHLVVRESCGCISPAVKRAVAGIAPPDAPRDIEATLREHRAAILAAMEAAAGPVPEGLNPAWASELVQAFSTEVQGKLSGTFRVVLKEVLRQVVATEGQPQAWHGAISELRRLVLPHLAGEARAVAEDLWQQARVMIAETTRRTQAAQMLARERQEQALRDMGQALARTMDERLFLDALVQRLPHLGIHSVYLAMYDDAENPTNTARLLLASEGHRQQPHAIAEAPDFPARHLVPEGWLPEGRRYSLIVEPLYVAERQLGFVVLEIGPREGLLYDALRSEIAGALQGVLTAQARQAAEAALKRAYAEVEQQVAQRTAELEREVAQRERLQQEVIEAQQRAIRELSTPIIPVLDRVIVMPLIGSIDSMRARDLMRAMLAGVREHRAKVVILDITGVPIVDSGVAAHLDKTIQAARLKGAHTIVTGISDAVAETIVDLGIDWSAITTLPDVQTGLAVALESVHQS